MKCALEAAKSAGKETKLRGMKLFVENKSYVYDFATDAIEERTVPGDEYRRGVASVHQISASGGSNINVDRWRRTENACAVIKLKRHIYAVIP